MSQEYQSIPKYADRGKGADSRWEAVEQSIRMINQISAMFFPHLHVVQLTRIIIVLIWALDQGIGPLWDFVPVSLIFIH